MKAWNVPVVIMLAGGAWLAAATLAVPAAAQDELSPTEVQQIEDLIHDYIMSHPEVIVGSVQKLRKREERAALERAKQNLVVLRDQLVSDPDSPVVGNPDGDVTIVEFFDYRCGYCKATFPVIRQLLAEDPGVRLVLKEFPILTPESDTAARAALAAQAQGKYFELHTALMSARGKLDDQEIVELAREAGLDTRRLVNDMASSRIKALIAANHDLAADLDIGGTPTFVIGDQVIPGALDIDAFRSLIQKQRSG